MRFVGYARYSTDKQNSRSAEDQIAEIRATGTAKKWVFVKAYIDAAISGASTIGRTAFNEMSVDAADEFFECIMVEDIDRLGRNLGDLAKFKERMDFLGIAIYSLSEGGFIGDLSIGFKGTMSAQFLRDLSQKTSRGLKANAKRGRSAGSPPYGYKTTLNRGEIEIEPNEAEVVRRIFRLYSIGHTPRDIAGILNHDKIPSPRGGHWNASTINGHRRRGVGIIRNTIYNGIRTHNRIYKVKDPDTGRRLTRERDKKDYFWVDVPHLRIVDAALWARVQDRIPATSGSRPYKRRQKYLLSGLMRCGECGASYITVGRSPYVKFGCSARRERRSCSNRRMISKNIIESGLLCAIEKHLVREETLVPALRAIEQEYKRLASSVSCLAPRLQKRLASITSAKRSLIYLIESGANPTEIRDRLLELDHEELDIKDQLKCAPVIPDLNPVAVSTKYREYVRLALHAATEELKYGQELRDAIRSLINSVTVYPRNDPYGRDIEFEGDIEKLYMHASTHSGMKAMVPGGGIEPPTRGFSIHCSTPELPGHGDEGVCRHRVGAF